MKYPTKLIGKKALVAGVASAALSLALAAPAQADVYAIAKTYLTNFQILGSDGQVLDFDTDFSTLSYTSSADYDGTLTGTAGFSASVPNGSGGTDFPSACLTTTGNCNPLPENTFPFIAPGPQGVDYIAADQVEEGSPIDNLPDFTTGANIGAQAMGSLSATEAVGSANVNNGLEATWQFALNQDQGISFTGNIATFLGAFVSAGEVAPSKASAATTFGISITNLGTGAVVFNTNSIPAADLLTQTTSANANGYAFPITTCGDLATVLGNCSTELTLNNFSFPTIALTAGTPYQLSARINANIDIARVEVPEPGVLALMGLGLLSMFAGLRRRTA